MPTQSDNYLANIKVGDRVTYMHSFSKKLLIDTVIDIQGNELVLDRASAQSTRNFRISFAEVITPENLDRMRRSYHYVMYNGDPAYAEKAHKEFKDRIEKN